MSTKLQKNAKIILSILFIFLGLFLLTYNYFGSIKSEVFNEKNIELLNQNIVLPEEVKNVDENDSADETTTTEVNSNGYIGYLDVPSVNIKRGFTSLDSEYNKLNYNIILVGGSTMPDVKNGNLILAGHNGNSKVGFFRNLYKLSDGAHAYVTYNGKVYDYLYKEQYNVPKVGTINIKRNADATTLTLITCHRTDDTLQVVYLFELVNVSDES